MQKTRVQSLGQEDVLEKGMATHSSILGWEIPWTEETIGLQRVRRDWATDFPFQTKPNGWLQLANDPHVENISRDLAFQLQARRLWCRITPQGEARGPGRKSTDLGVTQNHVTNPEGEFLNSLYLPHAPNTASSFRVFIEWTTMWNHLIHVCVCLLIVCLLPTKYKLCHSRDSICLFATAAPPPQQFPLSILWVILWERVPWWPNG